MGNVQENVLPPHLCGTIYNEYDKIRCCCGNGVVEFSGFIKQAIAIPLVVI